VLEVAAQATHLDPDDRVTLRVEIGMPPKERLDVSR
jgi:hypothetical protein